MKQPIALILWIIYLILLPFQFFPPGSLQIADFIMLLAFLLGINNFSINAKNLQLKSYLLFCLYSLIVGVLFALLYSDFSFLTTPLNYVYCFLTCIQVEKISKSSNFKNATIYAIFFAQLIQLFFFLRGNILDENLRVTINFHNPNQLGLWALNSFVITILFLSENRVSATKKILTTISLLLSIFFVVLSISQAAIISIVLILLSLMIYRIKYVIKYIPIIVVTSAIIWSNISSKVEESLIYTNAVNRIDGEVKGDDGDNGLEGRNYTRLFKYPQYLLFGAGEARNQRFSQVDLNEIHSTFANILFSYGFIGLLLYSLSFLSFFEKISRFGLCVFICYLVFTLVHNTLRWPFFWFLPIIMLSISNKDKILNTNVRN